MAWCSGLEPILQRDEPLAQRTTFRIGGRAAVLIEPSTDAELAAAYAAAARAGLPVHVLGGGSNLLVSDNGVPGVVLCMTRLADRSLSAEGCSAAGSEAAGLRVRARAGTSLERLISWTARAGLSGLECLAGIPGTVGGAVRMNAGGRYGGISDCVASVWCVDRTGKTYARQGRDVQWGYRSSDFQDPILRVEFDLQRKPPQAVELRRAQILAEKRASQPINMRSAGCFFKNPRGDSAGRMIEMLGLKGLRIGQASVSAKHANFIVNLGRATAGDVLALSETVRDHVHAEFGVSLENEVSCWGFPRQQPAAHRQFSMSDRPL